MQILKAYTDAGAMGQNNYGAPLPARAAGQAKSAAPSKSGDVINISDEARDLMQNRDNGNLSVTPQDAIYDQRGHIMRQFDTLQGELRALSSQFMLAPDATGLTAPLRSMQTRLAALRAQV